MGVVLLVTGGCNRYGYSAHIDSIAPGVFKYVRGWIHDPLADRRGGVCAQMYVATSATPGSWYPFGSPVCPTAFNNRTDVEQLFGTPTGFGFGDLAIGGMAQGTYTVCINVAPVGSPVADAPLDCTDMTIPFDEYDRSAIDGLSVNGGTLTAVGWYSLITTTLGEHMWHPAWVLDGVSLSREAPITTLVDRPDVVAAVGSTGQGYTLSTPITSGEHVLCIQPTDGFGNPVEPTPGHQFTCRSFTAP